MTAPTKTRPAPKPASARRSTASPSSTTDIKDGAEAVATRKVRLAAKKAGPKPQARPETKPEIDLTSFQDKEPSPINAAEARWFIRCAELDLESMTPEDVFAKAVQMTAGTAHRAWQHSNAAKIAHGKDVA